MGIKRLLCLGLTAAVVCTAVPVAIPAQEVQAETEEADANEGFQIENGVLKKYLGVEMDVIIPKGVTSIGSYTF